MSYIAEAINLVSFGGPIEECYLPQFQCLLLTLENIKSVAYKGIGTPVLQANGKILTSTIGTEIKKKGKTANFSDQTQMKVFRAERQKKNPKKQEEC